MRSDSAPSWAQAAAQASFPAYTVAAPTPGRVWAGGFGFGGDKTVSLEVMARVGDAEVATESHLLSHAAPNTLHLRLVVHELLRIAVPLENAPLKLPMSLAVEADNRTISVEGRDVSFTGLRVGQAWAGVAEVDENVGLRIVVNGSMEPTRISVLDGQPIPDS